MSAIDTWDDTEVTGLALVVQAEALVISDQATYEQAVHFRAGCKRLIEEIIAEYKPQKQAVDAAKKVILDKEKARLEHPTYAKKVTDDKLEAYDAAQRREKALAEARAAQEAKTSGSLVPAQAVEVPKVDGFGFSTHWHAVLTDIKALAKAMLDGQVAPEVLTINQKIADEIARSSKGTIKVPGLDFVSERRARG